MLRKFFFFCFITIMLPVSLAASSKQDEIYFLSLADIHFDPFISCYNTSERPCRIIQLLREANVNEWPGILARLDNSKTAFRYDTNYTLLKSTLVAAKQAANANHVKFVIVLGDFIGHDFHRYYRKYAHDPSRQGFDTFVKKTLQFVTNEIANTFPDISVYPVVGNNDTYSRDYGSKMNGDFFHDVAIAWSPLVKNNENAASLRKTLSYAGYYAVNRDSENLKLIILNSVLFSYKAKGADIENAAKQQFDWLHAELAEAKAHHQEVLIAMHIPVGIDVYATLKFRLFTLIEFWKQSYAQQFKAYLNEYHEQIAGVFSGHMHSDWFQVMTFPNGNEIAITGTPSVSPIFGNNPGFKIYQYSLKTSQVSDYYTYYYPLDEKKFNRIYQPYCHFCSVIDGVRKLNQRVSPR